MASALSLPLQDSHAAIYSWFGAMPASDHGSPGCNGSTNADEMYAGAAGASGSTGGHDAARAYAVEHHTQAAASHAQRPGSAEHLQQLYQQANNTAADHSSPGLGELADSFAVMGPSNAGLAAAAAAPAGSPSLQDAAAGAALPTSMPPAAAASAPSPQRQPRHQRAASSPGGGARGGGAAVSKAEALRSLRAQVALFQSAQLPQHAHMLPPQSPAQHRPHAHAHHHGPHAAHAAAAAQHAQHAQHVAAQQAPSPLRNEPLLLSPQRSGSGSIDPFCKPNNFLYKTELCKNWSALGTCRYGPKCQFAHGTLELRPASRPPRSKSDLCRTFAITGACPYGARCRFQHDAGSSAPAAPGGTPQRHGHLDAPPHALYGDAGFAGGAARAMSGGSIGAGDGGMFDLGGLHGGFSYDFNTTAASPAASHTFNPAGASPAAGHAPAYDASQLLPPPGALGALGGAGGSSGGLGASGIEALIGALGGSDPGAAATAAAGLGLGPAEVALLLGDAGGQQDPYGQYALTAAMMSPEQMPPPGSAAAMYTSPRPSFGGAPASLQQLQPSPAPGGLGGLYSPAAGALQRGRLSAGALGGVGGHSSSGSLEAHLASAALGGVKTGGGANSGAVLTSPLASWDAATAATGAVAAGAFGAGLDVFGGSPAQSGAPGLGGVLPGLGLYGVGSGPASPWGAAPALGAAGSGGRSLGSPGSAASGGVAAGAAAAAGTMGAPGSHQAGAAAKADPIHDLLQALSVQQGPAPGGAGAGAGGA